MLNLIRKHSWLMVLVQCKPSQSKEFPTDCVQFIFFFLPVIALVCDILTPLKQYNWKNNFISKFLSVCNGSTLHGDTKQTFYINIFWGTLVLLHWITDIPVFTLSDICNGFYSQSGFYDCVLYQLHPTNSSDSPLMLRVHSH